MSALAGGLVSVVLSAVPLAPVLGGATAGYLRDGDRREGLRVGAFAGLLATLPILAVLGLFVAVFGFLTVAPSPQGAVVGLLAFLVLGGLLVGAYTVGLSALGGSLGVLAREYRRRDRRGADAAASAEPTDAVPDSNR